MLDTIPQPSSSLSFLFSSKKDDNENDYEEINQRLKDIFGTCNILSFIDNITSHKNFCKFLDKYLNKIGYLKKPIIPRQFIPIHNHNEPEVCYGMYFLEYDIAFIHYFLNNLNKYSDIISNDQMSILKSIIFFFNIFDNHWIPNINNISIQYFDYSYIRFLCQSQSRKISDFLDFHISYQNGEYKASYYLTNNFDNHSILFSLNYGIDKFSFEIEIDDIIIKIEL